jgi:hypothetical protein
VIAYDLHREAEEEMHAAAARYEDRVPGLGLDFLDEVERAMVWVCQHPPASPPWPDVPAELGIRRKLLDRFPFGLPYLQLDGRIVFLAVAHLSREPAYWLDRARDRPG